jgi:hypothetical protein
MLLTFYIAQDIFKDTQDLRYCHNFLLVNEAEKPINSFYFVPSVTQRKNFKCASYVSPNTIILPLGYLVPLK